jgi:hypothetical protein
MLNKPETASIPGQRRRRMATRLLNIHRRYTPSEPPLSGGPIRVVCVSDTHNHQPDIPPGDVLIHSGDLTEKGTFEELQNQLDWLASQPHSHKIVIAGNHDLLLDEELVGQRRVKNAGVKDDLDGEEQYGEEENDPRTAKDLNWGELRYLKDEQITVEVEVPILNSAGFSHLRNLRIYGSPTTHVSSSDGPSFHAAFQCPRDEDVWKGKVPLSTDILVTHGPPHLHLDSPTRLSHVGSIFLAREIARVRPRLVVFGHIHNGHGLEDLVFDGVQSRHDDIQRGVSWSKLANLAISVMSEKVMCRVSEKTRRGLEKERVTTLVNAAVVGGSWFNELRHAVTVVEI